MSVFDDRKFKFLLTKNETIYLKPFVWQLISSLLQFSKLNLFYLINVLIYTSSIRTSTNIRCNISVCRCKTTNTILLH